MKWEAGTQWFPEALALPEGLPFCILLSSSLFSSFSNHPQLLVPSATALRPGRNDSTRDQDKPSPAHRLPHLWTAWSGQRQGECAQETVSALPGRKPCHTQAESQSLLDLPDSLLEESEHNQIHTAQGLPAPSKDARGSGKHLPPNAFLRKGTVSLPGK